MKPRQVKQSSAQAARLPRRRRVDLADVLNRGLLQEHTSATIDTGGDAPDQLSPRPNGGIAFYKKRDD